MEQKNIGMAIFSLGANISPEFMKSIVAYRTGLGLVGRIWGGFQEKIAEEVGKNIASFEKLGETIPKLEKSIRKAEAGVGVYTQAMQLSQAAVEKNATSLARNSWLYEKKKTQVAQLSAKMEGLKKAFTSGSITAEQYNKKFLLLSKSYQKNFPHIEMYEKRLLKQNKALGLAEEKFDKNKSALLDAEKNLGDMNVELDKSNKLMDKYVTDALNIGAAFFGFKAGIAILTVLISTMVLAGTAYRKFQSTIIEAGTMLDKQHLPLLDGMETKVRQLAIQYGQSAEDVSKALYHILSAQIPVAHANTVLEESAKLAAAGFISVEDAANVLTTTINSYGMSATEAAHISDVLFMTVRKGKTTMHELSKEFGRIASSAAQAGISLEELATMYAAVTGAGLQTSIATTSLGAIIRDFLRPTTEAQAMAFEEFGVRLDAITLKEQGVIKTLKQLSSASTDQLAVMFPQIRGLRALTALRMRLAKVEEIHTSMMNASGATMEAYQRVHGSLTQRVKVLTSSFKELIFLFGEGSMPFLKLVTGTLIVIVKNLKSVVAWMNTWHGTTIVTTAAMLLGITLVTSALNQMLKVILATKAVTQAWSFWKAFFDPNVEVGGVSKLITTKVREASAPLVKGIAKLWGKIIANSVVSSIISALTAAFKAIGAFIAAHLIVVFVAVAAVIAIIFRKQIARAIFNAKRDAEKDTVKIRTKLDTEITPVQTAARELLDMIEGGESPESKIREKQLEVLKLMTNEMAAQVNLADSKIFAEEAYKRSLEAEKKANEELTRAARARAYEAETDIRDIDAQIAKAKQNLEKAQKARRSGPNVREIQAAAGSDEVKFTSEIIRLEEKRTKFDKERIAAEAEIILARKIIMEILFGEKEINGEIIKGYDQAIAKLLEGGRIMEADVNAIAKKLDILEKINEAYSDNIKEGTGVLDIEKAVVRESEIRLEKSRKQTATIMADRHVLESTKKEVHAIYLLEEARAKYIRQNSDQIALQLAWINQLKRDYDYSAAQSNTRLEIESRYLEVLKMAGLEISDREQTARDIMKIEESFENKRLELLGERKKMEYDLQVAETERNVLKQEEIKKMLELNRQNGYSLMIHANMLKNYKDKISQMAKERDLANELRKAHQDIEDIYKRANEVSDARTSVIDARIALLQRASDLGLADNKREIELLEYEKESISLKQRKLGIEEEIRKLRGSSFVAQKLGDTEEVERLREIIGLKWKEREAVEELIRLARFKAAEEQKAIINSAEITRSQIALMQRGMTRQAFAPVFKMETDTQITNKILRDMQKESEATRKNTEDISNHTAQMARNTGGSATYAGN